VAYLFLCCPISQQLLLACLLHLHEKHSMKNVLLHGSVERRKAIGMPDGQWEAIQFTASNQHEASAQNQGCLVECS
jgi:hypothetical protein